MLRLGLSDRMVTKISTVKAFNAGKHAAQCGQSITECPCAFMPYYDHWLDGYREIIPLTGISAVGYYSLNNPNYTKVTKGLKIMSIFDRARLIAAAYSAGRQAGERKDPLSACEDCYMSEFAHWLDGYREVNPVVKINTVRDLIYELSDYPDSTLLEHPCVLEYNDNTLRLKVLEDETRV